MIRKDARKIGEILIDKRLITNQQLETALQEQKRTKEFIGKILIRNKIITEEDLLEALSLQFDISYISLKDKYIDWDIVKQFSSSLILDTRSFPLKKDEYTVTFAITNPLDVWTIAKIESEIKGLRLKLALVSEEDMREVIERYIEYMKRLLEKCLKKPI
jgi:hypothetical protein